MEILLWKFLNYKVFFFKKSIITVQIFYFLGSVLINGIFQRNVSILFKLFHILPHGWLYYLLIFLLVSLGSVFIISNSFFILIICFLPRGQFFLSFVSFITLSQRTNLCDSLIFIISLILSSLSKLQGFCNL